MSGELFSTSAEKKCQHRAESHHLSSMHIPAYITSFSGVKAKSLLPTLITREVEESLVVDEVEVK